MSSTTEEYQDDTVSGWVGWVYFASVLMIVIGGMNAIQGLAALLRDEDYWVAVGQGAVVTFDITAWGWIHLIIGLLLITAGWGLFSRSTWGAAMAIFLASLKSARCSSNGMTTACRSTPS